MTNPKSEVDGRAGASTMPVFILAAAGARLLVLNATKTPH